MKPETYKRILEDATGTFDKSKKRKVDVDWAQWVMNNCNDPLREIEWLVNNLKEEAYNDIIDALNEQANEHYY
jgi:hypothetical protein